MMAGVILSCRASVWMLGVVWEQERRREVDARLAVAEERLRFSRDLHDVFGRTLSVVAVKSELAAELAKRGDPRGAEQMLEVRQIAQDALKEVRDVVNGYRAADLAVERGGAREILSSAGVDTWVAGEALNLPPRAQEALAWVVREGVTNVVRHSDATGCTIEVTSDGERCGVVVTNDGAAVVAQGAGIGSGLRGLRERLVKLGGTLDVTHHGDTFAVRATVPLSLIATATGTATARELERT